MKKNITFVIITLILTSGCVSNTDSIMPGKYMKADNPQSYFLLNEDGSFNRHFDDGRTISGKYELIDSTHIKLTYLPFGEFRIVEKKGSSAFAFEGGGVYEKID